jgi:hypothetical protein
MKKKGRVKYMDEQMEFPVTFDEFAKEYGFKDHKEIYTNGDDLIPVFRVKQWIENDNKLRKIETDTAYECGKHANQWIPVTEDLPKERKAYLISIIKTDSGFQLVPRVAEYVGIVPGAIANYIGKGENKWKILDDGGLASPDYRDLLECVAWRELPEPYKPTKKLANTDQSWLEYADMPTVAEENNNG